MNNKLQYDPTSVQATYMSQAEANDVMELWAQRQREESARQAMVTIHDVAEATQLTPQEIQRLLQEVRSSRPSPRAATPTPLQTRDVPLWAALVKVGPISGIVTYLYAITINTADWQWHNRLIIMSGFWTALMVVLYLGRMIIRAAIAFQVRTAEKGSDPSYPGATSQRP